mgnify:CR=1 FL=1
MFTDGSFGARPQQKAPSGELSIAGQVYSKWRERWFPECTVFTDSQITTAEKSNATVNLSKLGRLSARPSSSLKLGFYRKEYPVDCLRTATAESQHWLAPLSTLQPKMVS